MRKELNRIERAVQYLNGELTDIDKIAYEQEMNKNSEIAKLTETVNLLETAIKRSELRAQIEKHASGGFGKMPWIIGSILLILAAVFIWFQISPVQESVEPEVKLQDRHTEEIQPESNLATGEEDEKGASITLGGHELWVEPDVQTFRFESQKGSIITGKQGTLIIVPADGFTDKEGRVLKGSVEFHLVEALQLEDMVLYKLHTVSNGASLESGGMFYIDATVNGQKAEINPKRPLYIEIPTPELKAGMLAFRGEVVDGKINWVEPRALNKFLVHIPLDSLDFLPTGFDAEVERHLPFKQYIQASKHLTDSLYYSLPDYPIAGATYQYSDTLSEVTDKYSVESCGIHPHTIETIKKPRFNKSFIATHEFEERIQVLHQAPNGEDLLQIYVDNLDKNLWEVDAMVANASRGSTQTQFEIFAAQKLTKVADGAIYASQLSVYYGKERTEINNYRRNLAAQLSRKNLQELNKLKRNLEDFDRQNNIFSPTSPSNPVTREVYATPWYSMGWGNIDLYLKMLESGSRSVEIVVEDRSEKTEVSQWLGEINAYTNLEEKDGKFQAVFPRKRERLKNTWVFALSGQAKQFEWAFREYNPYKVQKIELEMVAATEADIRRDLRNVGERFGRIKAERKEQKRFNESMINSQLAAQARTAEIFRERQLMVNAISEAQRSQQNVRLMMANLMKVGYPCGRSSEISFDKDASSVKEEQIFTVVEQMPQFVGGQRALMQYLEQNMKYPRSAMDAGIEGVVYVTFVVDPDGRINDPKVVRGIHPACDEVALEAVRNMPRWIPGSQRNASVPVQYNLPITFRMK